MSITPQEDSRGALAVFAYRKGPREGEEIGIPRSSATVGQGDGNDIVIPDDSVSTRHARLDFENGGWRITDLNSTNGTYVEGVRLAPEVPTPLLDEVDIRFGGADFKFHTVEGADMASAPADASADPQPAGPATRRRVRIPLWVAVLVVVLILLAIVYFAWYLPGGDAVTQSTVLHAVQAEIRLL
ncbi:MAG TPA: FHA domain-containing protein [Longimicrobiaceae bacterium]|nr:FHA domain-containing protein [Longimicrobiaceae bacterium]